MRAITLLAQLSGGEGDPVRIEGGLTNEARVFVALMGLGAVVVILVLLRRRQLRSKYALLWTGLAAVLGVLGLFPGLLTWVSETVGIYYPPALFLLVATGFLFAVVIQFSWELSRLEERSRFLAEETALLHAEIDALRRARDAAPETEGNDGDAA
jgi:hypothetical protein